MNRFKSIKTLILIGAAAVLAASCSVKEDRSMLPNSCIVDMTAFVGYGTGFDLNFWDGSDPKNTLHCSAEEIETPFYHDVKRTTVDWAFYSSSLDNTITDKVLNYGPEPGRLYADHGTVDATGETSHIIAQPYSQSARIQITLTSESDLDLSNLRAKITSNAIGLYLSDFTAIEGKYVYEMDVDANGVLDFFMYRQPDYSQSIDFYTDDGTSVIFSIGLGTEIQKKDYRWTDPSLKDIQLKADITKTGVSVTVLPWTSGKEDEFDL